MEPEQEQPSGKEPRQALPVDDPGEDTVRPVEPPATAATIFDVAVAGVKTAPDDSNEQQIGPSNIVANNFTGLPIRELIGAPLKAAAEAQYDLTATMISYIEQVGFQKKTDKDKLVANVLKFELERPVVADDGSVKPTKVEVQAPVLGLTPIPALLVEDVNVDFQLEVKMAQRTTGKETATGNAELKYDWYKGSLTVRGEVSASRENTRSTDHMAKYQVNVRARQQPPTDGMTKLMGLLASAVEPITLPKPS